MCKWLALDDDFYTSIKTIKGQKGSEAIQGKWIIEVEELLAFLANDKSGSVREEEAKAFLSRQSEYYRKPYERHPSDTPRTCIFMGTTNRDQFLTDPTGNRRWFPVRCNGNGKQLYEHETECRAYIRQAWAEMLVAFKSDDELARPTASPELEAAIKAQQETATTEEPWAGLIDGGETEFFNPGAVERSYKLRGNIGKLKVRFGNKQQNSRIAPKDGMGKHRDGPIRRRVWHPARVETAV